MKTLIRGVSFIPVIYDDSRFCYCPFCGTIFLARNSDIITDGDVKYIECYQCEGSLYIDATYRLVKGE